jgi:hypothetical protein
MDVICKIFMQTGKLCLQARNILFLSLIVFSLASCASAIERAKEILDTPKEQGEDPVPPKKDNNEVNNENNDKTKKQEKTAN